MNRTLLALTGLLCALSGMAQSTMPWNPDANDDSYIGATDMLSTLAVYGQQFGIDSSLTCDYDGTPIEEFFGNVWNGDIIIDSMLVQYHTIDSAQVYIAGCPDPIWETVSYERAWMTSSFFSSGSGNYMRWEAQSIGYQRMFYLYFYQEQGDFRFSIYDDEVDQTGLDGVLGSSNSRAQSTEECCDSQWFIPFPPDRSWPAQGPDAFAAPSPSQAERRLSSAAFCSARAAYPLANS